MRKILLCAIALFVSSVALAALSKKSKLGPTEATLSQYDVSERAVILSPISDNQCMNRIEASSTANFTLRVLNGGTTFYGIDVGTTGAGTTATFARDWDEDQLCAVANSSFTVKITTATNGTTSVSTQRLSYVGFTY